MYFTGCPVFAPEKPILTPYYPETLVDRQRSGEWYGELKLKSKRGVITINEDNKVDFFLYKTKNTIKIKGEALNRIENMGLPPCSIFDCSLLEHNYETRLWIFDCLVFGGKQLHNIAMIKRRQHLDRLVTDDLIWVPLISDFWMRELDLIKLRDSSLIKETALKSGIPYQDFKRFVTGMVIKNKNTFLSFPAKTRFVASSMFKINL